MSFDKEKKNQRQSIHKHFDTHFFAGVIRQHSQTTASAAKLFQPLFTKGTKAIVWGMQTRAVQSMLDFDFICRWELVEFIYMITGAWTIQLIRLSFAA